MMVIPFMHRKRSGADDRGPVVFVVILERDNVERMGEADPVDIQLRTYGMRLPTARPIGDLDLVICYEKDKSAVLEAHKAGDIEGLMAYLERGRRVLAGEPHPPYPAQQQN